MARILLSPAGFYHADSAVIAGDVTLGKDANIWFGAVIRGDVAAIRIGARVNVQDNAVIHCDSGKLQVIEDDVSIAHAAVVHGVRVGCCTLIGMGAKVLGRATIGRGCIIAAGAVGPEGMEVPDGAVVMGVPGRIRRQTTPEEIAHIQWIPPHYVRLAQRWVRGEFTSLAQQ
jgi:carbonic anhydrase/acetyltransferase-like protein (isoleucine patch superfamily)